MLRSKYLVLLSLLLLVSLAVAACGVAAPPAAPAQQPEAAAPAEGEAAAPAAGEFNWKAHEGTAIKLLLNKHPYQEALVAELPKFEELTGIKVTYDIFPEQNYFDKVTIDLSGGQGGYDVFMTGAYMIWQYAPAGWMEPLEPYINDPNKTNPDYDFEDIFADLRDSERWNLEPGRQNLGQGSQYAIPWGFETNAVMYRADLFEKHNLKPPESLDELVALSKQLKELEPDMAGIVVRGSKNWATIHPGYMTMYSSYGCEDYNDKMEPQMNSACAIEVTEKWVEMVRDAGPEAWTTYTWYQAGSDFGAGKAAILFDADILGYFQNVPDASAISGNVAWAPGPKGPDGELNTNIWIWSLSMNAASKNKDAGWYFMQWATGKEFLTTGAVQYTLVDPVRQSVWDNPDFQKKLSEAKNYYETFQTIMDNGAKIQFTPQPLFFETTTEWAATLQSIYAGEVTAEEGLNALVEKLNGMLKQAGIQQ